MKRYFLQVLLLAFAYTVSACGKEDAKADLPTTGPGASVQDQASLVAALRAAGATVELGDPVSQPFFNSEGQMIRVNGQDVQVFEYESAEAMGSEASQVAPDGSSVGTSMVTWIAPPHFFKAGRIIVLYVGDDRPVLDLLEKMMGPQFAG